MKKRTFINFDERNKQVAYKVIAIMYFLTIIAMQAIVIYRQFALGQDIHDFEDIAILMTVNSLYFQSLESGNLTRNQKNSYLKY